MDITTHYINLTHFPSPFTEYGHQSSPFTTVVSRTEYNVNKRTNDVRSPTNPEVQTAPLNFEEIGKRLNDLRLEGRQGENQWDSDKDDQNYFDPKMTALIRFFIFGSKKDGRHFV